MTHISGIWPSYWLPCILAVIAMFFSGADRVHACSGCPVAPPDAMTQLADAMRCEAETHAVRDYASAAWWREKYPDADDETLEPLIRFHALMVARSGLDQKMRDSLQLIRQARSTSGLEADISTPTAKVYRESVLAVERALDVHPALAGYKEQLESLRTEQQEVAAEQGEVLRAWHRERRDRTALFNEAVQLAAEAYSTQVSALRERAGVEPGEGLPDRYQAEYEAIGKVRRDALAFARETMQRVSDPEYIETSRVEDGSKATFDAANERYAAFGESEKLIRENMTAMRNRLRATDPEISRLRALQQDASREHLAAISARADVQEAQAFVEGMDAQRIELEQEARELRHAILQRYPEKRPIFVELAKVGGMGRVPENYWDLQD